MIDLWEGIQQAIWLMITLDPELLEIATRSLLVTFTALFIASAVAMPLAAFLAVRRFRWRRLIIALMNALIGLMNVIN